MRTQRAHSATVLAMVLAAACRSPTAAPRTTPAELADSRAAVERLEGFRDEMCACADLACMATTARARAAWLAETYGGAALSDEQRAARDAANARFDECSARTPVAVTGPVDAALVEMQRVTDEMCGCRDQPCVERVTARMAELAERYRDTKADDAQLKTATAIMERMTACATTATAGTP